MQNETTFPTLFALLWIALSVIRGYYHWKAQAGRQERERVGGALLITLQALMAVPILGGVLAYIFKPAWVAWAAVPLPSLLRWFGAVIGVISLMLLFWVQHTLGKNFSPVLRIRADHTLVVHGPYRWVRHPMYTALLLLSVGFFLLSANWFVGGSSVLGIVLIMVVRTPMEERMMLDAFGDQYRRYMERTGRFLPRGT